MNGKIFFDDLQDLTDFLRYFTGSTATFKVQKRGSQWVLTFLGGF